MVALSLKKGPNHQGWTARLRYPQAMLGWRAKHGPTLRQQPGAGRLNMSFSLRNPVMLEALTATAILVGGAVAAWTLRRKRKSEEEIERERRLSLVRAGRIVDGTVVDIADLNPGESGRPEGLKLILYRYEISGVIYNCSQDVTHMTGLVDIYQCRLSFPASIRYDAHNPENSIIVAENWTGLRNSAAINFGPPDQRLDRHGFLSGKATK